MSSESSSTPNDHSFTPTKPTILLISGAYHTPTHYAPLLSLLSSHGYPTLCPSLPTCNNAIPPTARFSDDVDLIRSVLTDLVEKEGKDVVVIAHSYGGAVAVEGVGGFGKGVRQRERRGERGGVAGVVFLCAFVPEKCEIFGEWARKGDVGAPPKYVVFEDGVTRITDPIPMFYDDLDTATAQQFSEKLVVHSLLAWAEPITQEAWKEIPSTYLVCRNDKAIPVARQVEMTEVASGEGADMVVEWCDAAHSPFASVPGFVVEVLERAVARMD
ncbi:alpha/beta-hydrolase [Saccharata proteae CBS 121410]|uniref:Alpha/beta-hydrolase n=1 Tax=Saccharata proteae CBS 121410 TaxID=1314787 RepID=A0A9P4HT81_9PEZI|nr:alpha/beta-hydrolase [Saccharata proteae CBS 121410]